jgi:L-alanine-DL-glutamate epimerase-like enolase superfamily enzyme
MVTNVGVPRRKSVDTGTPIAEDDARNVRLFYTLVQKKEGYVHLPTKPGLGVELDFVEINKRTVFRV